MTTMTAAAVHEPEPRTSTRRTAVQVALLFLTATASFLIADTLIADVLDRADYLSAGPAYATTLTAGALLAFVDGLAVVGIALLLYPLLKRHSEPLALGYVAFRVAELAAILLYLATPLLVLNVGEGPTGSTVQASTAGHLGGLLRAQYDVALVMIYLFTSVAGVFLAAGLDRARLIPRPLAVLGLIGYPVLLVGTVLHMFGISDVTGGIGLLAVVPGGLFELLLPIWLLTRGFSPSKPRKRTPSTE